MKMSVRFPGDEFEKLKQYLLVYKWGLDILLTKLQVICEDFASLQDSNPIEHIKGRIKAPESIAEKLLKMNVDITADNAKRYLTDIAGIRVICSYARDVFNLAGILKSMPNVKVLKEKDYVGNPKPSGYRSYHLVLETQVYHLGRTEPVPVEFQIRTAAMDFWATLEHKVRYKYKELIPQHLCDELVMCADKIAELDERMFLIHDIISLINQDSNQDGK